MTEEQITQLKENPRMKEMLSRFNHTFPTPICSGVTHREVEEIALETARVFGESYIHRGIYGIDAYLTKAHLGEPKYDERNHTVQCGECLDSTGLDFTSAEIGLPRSREQLAKDNPDMRIETTLRNDLGMYPAWAEIHLDLVYRLTRKQ